MAERRSPPVIRDNTPEEEATAKRGIAADPDARSLDPSRPLRQVVPLDDDVLEALRAADPERWRERANDILRTALLRPEAAE